MNATTNTLRRHPFSPLGDSPYCAYQQGVNDDEVCGETEFAQPHLSDDVENDRFVPLLEKTEPFASRAIFTHHFAPSPVAQVLCGATKPDDGPLMSTPNTDRVTCVDCINKLITNDATTGVHTATPWRTGKPLVQVEGYPLYLAEDLAAVATDPDFQTWILRTMNKYEALREAAETVLARVDHTNIHTPIKDMQDTWDLLREAIR